MKTQRIVSYLIACGLFVLAVCGGTARSGAQTSGSVDPRQSGGGISPIGVAAFIEHAGAMVREQTVSGSWTHHVAISNGRMFAMPVAWQPWIDQFLAGAKLCGTHGTGVEAGTVLKAGWWSAGRWIRIDSWRKEGETAAAHGNRFALEVFEAEAVWPRDDPQPPIPAGGLSMIQCGQRNAVLERMLPCERCC